MWENMPERMLPLTVEGEQVILVTLTGELRRNFGVKVSGRLEMERGEGKEKPVYRYAVLGASNADRIGDVLEGLKKDVVKITKGGWRPSKQGVAEMLEMMKDVDLEGRVVILYGLDNSVFYSEDSQGQARQADPGSGSPAGPPGRHQQLYAVETGGGGRTLGRKVGGWGWSAAHEDQE